MADTPDLYNIVTIKNVSDEDFSFSVDGVPYLLKAGEVRNFPKFMATLGVKHLIDEILNKRDPSGKLTANQGERDKLAGEIVQGEEQYAKPVIPTDQDIVEEINKPSELDAVLAKNKSRLKVEEPEAILPPQEEEETSPEPEAEPTPKEKTVKKAPKQAPVGTEEFVGLKTPSRDELLSYAQNTLKLDLDDPKTKASFDKMSDEELAKELQYEPKEV